MLKTIKMKKNWTKVYSSNNPIKTEIIKQMLEEHNINAVEMNQQDSSYNMFGNIQIYVQQEFSKEALKLIEKNNNERNP